MTQTGETVNKLKSQIIELQESLENLQAEKQNRESFFAQKLRKVRDNRNTKVNSLRNKNSNIKNKFSEHEKWQEGVKKQLKLANRRNTMFLDKIRAFKSFYDRQK